MEYRLTDRGRSLMPYLNGVGGMGAAARGRHPGKQKVEATHPPWFDDTIEEVLCENSGRALGDGLSRTQIGWVGRIYLI